MPENAINCRKIDIQELSPIVYRCVYLNLLDEYPAGTHCKARPIYDYEIEYFDWGKGSVILDNVTYPVGTSDVIFKKPGMINEGIMPYTSYLICFDLLGETRRDIRNYGVYQTKQFQYVYSNDWLEKIPTHTKNVSVSQFEYLFKNILKEFIKGDSSSKVLIKSYLLQLLFYLYPENNIITDPGSLGSSAYYTLFRKVFQYIDNNLSEDLNLNKLSEISGLCPTYFHSIFTSHFKTTPLKYINSLRIKKAKELLVNSRLSISEIAEKTGFSSTTYFSNLFTKCEKQTPGEFRRFFSNI